MDPIEQAKAKLEEQARRRTEHDARVAAVRQVVLEDARRAAKESTGAGPAGSAPAPDVAGTSAGPEPSREPEPSGPGDSAVPVGRLVSPPTPPTTPRPEGPPQPSDLVLMAGDVITRATPVLVARLRALPNEARIGICIAAVLICLGCLAWGLVRQQAAREREREREAARLDGERQEREWIEAQERAAAEAKRKREAEAQAERERSRQARLDQERRAERERAQREAARAQAAREQQERAAREPTAPTPERGSTSSPAADRPPTTGTPDGPRNDAQEGAHADEGGREQRDRAAREEREREERARRADAARSEAERKRREGLPEFQLARAHCASWGRQPMDTDIDVFRATLDQIEARVRDNRESIARTCFETHTALNAAGVRMRIGAVLTAIEDVLPRGRGGDYEAAARELVRRLTTVTCEGQTYPVTFGDLKGFTVTNVRLARDVSHWRVSATVTNDTDKRMRLAQVAVEFLDARGGLVEKGILQLTQFAPGEERAEQGHGPELGVGFSSLRLRFEAAF